MGRGSRNKRLGWPLSIAIFLAAIGMAYYVNLFPHPPIVYADVNTFPNTGGGGGGGTVAVNNTVQVATSTLNAAVWVQNTVNVNASNNTVPVSVPTVGAAVQNTVQVATSTLNAAAWVQNTVNVNASNNTVPVSVPTVGAAVQNTVQVATSTLNVAAWVQNTVQVAAHTVAVPTSTLNVAAWIQNTIQAAIGTADPCANPNVAMQYFAMATASATATAVCVAASGKTCYLCGFSWTEPQGVGTVGVQFLSASSTPCGSATPMTGKYALGVSHPAGYSVATTSVGNSMCLSYTGAGVDPEGVVSYKQQ